MSLNVKVSVVGEGAQDGQEGKEPLPASEATTWRPRPWKGYAYLQRSTSRHPKLPPSQSRAGFN